MYGNTYNGNMYVPVHTYACDYANIHICTQRHTCPQMHACTTTYTHILVFMHIYTSMETYVLVYITNITHDRL